jgi:hypothetical protein
MQTQRRQSVMTALVLAAVMVLGAGMASAVLVAGSHAATPAQPAAKAQAGLPSAAALMAILHPASSTPSVLHGTTKTNSGNWAGYADVAKTAGTITEVFSEWYIPAATCNEKSGATYQVQWIGIDGFGSGSVEQLGSFDYCSGPGATPAYYTWYEFYPYNSVQIVADSSAGALISAYVLYNPTIQINGIAGVYTLELFDPDNGVSFTEIAGGYDLGYTPADVSAECISEAPSGSSGVLHLADYGTTTFYACSDTIGTHTGGIGGQGSVSTVYRINQVGASTKTDQSTGNLSTYLYTESTFSITWKHSN